jgi:hypothetical protein
VSEDPKHEVDEVAREILRYFLRYPDTTDSLAGIARWRLMQETVRHSVERTSKAMQWLISEGFMQEETRVASGKIFRLNVGRREEAAEFMRKVDGGSAHAEQDRDNREDV